MSTNVVPNLTFEEKVNQDFMYFLEHYQESFDTLKTDHERDICQVIVHNLFYIVIFIL